MSSENNHRTRCSIIGQRAPAKATQGGFVFVVVLVALVLGSLTIYTQSLNESVSKAERDRITLAALTDAKQALIAWSAEYEYLGDDGLWHKSGGHVPCPDADNDGDSEGAACTRIGRLPWKTLKTPIYRDASGEPLWYLISYKFLNKKTLPVNSDTKGELSVSGALNADDVIAVIFAPGPGLTGQSRTNPADLTNWANYLEGVNLESKHITTQQPSEQANDQVVLITAADLFPAVERRVEEGIRESIVPMLQYYQEAWSLTENAGYRMAPFPASFNPAATNDAMCGEPTLTQGLLPISDCGMEWDLGSTLKIDGATGKCEVPTSMPDEYAWTALRCTLTLVKSGGDDDDDDDDEEGWRTISVQIQATLKRGARTLAMPLNKQYLVHGEIPPRSNSVKTYSKPQKDENGHFGDIKVTYKADYRIYIDDDDDDDGGGSSTQYKTTVVLPIYRVDRQFALEHQHDKTAWAKLNPGWFFENEWYRITYYATVKNLLPCDKGGYTCPSEGERLSLIHNDTTTEHDMLLVMTGYPISGAERPSAQLRHYLEQKALDADPTGEIKTFEQAALSRQFNDRIIPVSP